MWGADHPQLDPRTARLAVVSIPRGTGLVHSAFGLLVARKTHAAVVGRMLRLSARLPASFAELDRHLVHGCRAGWLDAAGTYVQPAAAPERSDPKHLIVTQPRRLRCTDVDLWRECEVASALWELRSAGARAVPLLIAHIPCDGELRYGVMFSEMTAEAWRANAAEQCEFLKSLGGVYSALPGLAIEPPHSNGGSGWPDLQL